MDTRFISISYQQIIFKPELLSKLKVYLVFNIYIFFIYFCSLDSLLGGGLFASKIYEICGPSACGKTQLSFSILLNIIITTKRDILYIDTKNKFSVNRIKQILKTKYLMTDIEV